MIIIVYYGPFLLLDSKHNNSTTVFWLGYEDIDVIC